MTRSDKEKNKTKIIREVIKDPLQSQRDIADKVWMSVSTVNSHIRDLPKSNKNEHIDKIIKKDLEIVDIATDILKWRLEKADDEGSKMSTRDIIASADVSAKRYSLFKWNATDEDWGLKEFIDEEKLKAIESLRRSFIQ